MMATMATWPEIQWCVHNLLRVPYCNSWSPTGLNAYQPYYSNEKARDCYAPDWTLLSSRVNRFAIRAGFVIAPPVFATEHIFEL